MDEYMCICIKNVDINISYEKGKEYYYEYDYYNNKYDVYSESILEETVESFSITEFNEIFIEKSDLINRKISKLLHEQLQFKF